MRITASWLQKFASGWEAKAAWEKAAALPRTTERIEDDSQCVLALERVVRSLASGLPCCTRDIGLNERFVSVQFHVIFADTRHDAFIHHYPFDSLIVIDRDFYRSLFLFVYACLTGKRHMLLLASWLCLHRSLELQDSFPHLQDFHGLAYAEDQRMACLTTECITSFLVLHEVGHLYSRQFGHAHAYVKIPTVAFSRHDEIDEWKPFSDIDIGFNIDAVTREILLPEWAAHFLPEFSSDAFVVRSHLAQYSSSLNEGRDDHLFSSLCQFGSGWVVALLFVGGRELFRRQRTADESRYPSMYHRAALMTYQVSLATRNLRLQNDPLEQLNQLEALLPAVFNQPMLTAWMYAHCCSFTMADAIGPGINEHLALSGSTPSFHFRSLLEAFDKEWANDFFSIDEVRDALRTYRWNEATEHLWTQSLESYTATYTFGGPLSTITPLVDRLEDIQFGGFIGSGRTHQFGSEAADRRFTEIMDMFSSGSFLVVKQNLHNRSSER